MKLTFLGTGTSTGVPTVGCSCPVCASEDPRDHRTRPSLKLDFDGRTILIDTAPDFRAQALRERIERVDAILFTHAHADHVLGLDDVRPYYFRQNQPIPIYADDRTMDTLERIFQYIFDGKYPYGGILRVEPHRIPGPVELWGVVFTPLPVLHGNLPILGFRFGSVAYVTDFSELPESTLALMEGLDTLILSALRPKPHPAHSTVAHSLSVVERLKPRRAFFTHIAHEISHQATEAELPPNVRIAYDGLALEWD